MNTAWKFLRRHTICHATGRTSQLSTTEKNSSTAALTRRCAKCERIVAKIDSRFKLFAWLLFLDDVVVMTMMMMMLGTTTTKKKRR
jgi:hypothetical protein